MAVARMLGPMPVQEYTDTFYSVFFVMKSLHKTLVDHTFQNKQMDKKG